MYSKEYDEVEEEDHHPDWVPCGGWADLWVPELATHYGKCPRHGQSYAVYSNDYCTECAEAEGWFWPYLAEGDAVVAHGKPGVVRWVLPAGKGVCVVFGDSGSDSAQMLWFYGDDIDLIEAA